ncbi:MAG: PEP-CTERM sorting domain-containing protein [Kiritimatiellales bacterium]
MRNRVKLNTIIISAIILTFALNSSAIPMWDVDFSGMAEGVAPTLGSAVAGQTNTRPTGVAAAGITVTNNYTAGGVILPGSSAVFSHPSGSENRQLTFVGATADYTAGETFVLSFKALANREETSTIGNTLQLKFRNASNNIFSTVTFRGNGDVLLSTTLGGGTTTFLSVYNHNELMDIEIAFNFADGATGSLALNINGNPVGDLALGAANPLDWGIRDFWFERGGANISFEWALTDIQTIPEPGTSAFLFVGVAGATLIVRRRNKL